MDDFTKSERKTLRALASEAYDAEARACLEELASEFARWQSGEIHSADLLDAIHSFHQGRSRELWSTYHSLKDDDLVARGVAMGYLALDKIPEPCRQKVAAHGFLLTA